MTYTSFPKQFPSFGTSHAKDAGIRWCKEEDKPGMAYHHPSRPFPRQPAAPVYPAGQNVQHGQGEPYVPKDGIQYSQEAYCNYAPAGNKYQREGTRNVPTQPQYVPKDGIQYSQEAY